MTRVQRIGALAVLTCALGFSLVIAAQQSRVTIPLQRFPQTSPTTSCDAPAPQPDANAGSWLSMGARRAKRVTAR